MGRVSRGMLGVRRVRMGLGLILWFRGLVGRQRGRGRVVLGRHLIVFLTDVLHYVFTLLGVAGVFYKSETTKFYFSLDKCCCHLLNNFCTLEYESLYADFLWHFPERQEFSDSLRHQKIASVTWWLCCSLGGSECRRT